jgi:formate dehydrogenase maturation protein FdhE
MDTAKVDSADDVLTCPRCGGKPMLVYIEQDEAQSVRCASCRNLVAYTSNLIRILNKT